MVDALLAAMVDDARLPPQARAQAGDAVARLGDPRKGVGLAVRAHGRAPLPAIAPLPDIAWCEVPEGLFWMGSSDADGLAWDDEKPQHEVHVSAFRIARYPITNTQYALFVQDGGYTDLWRRCWTQAGWKWKGDRSAPDTYGGVYDLPNHPVVMTRWYEAVAYCRWLTARLREAGEIGPDEEVRLPSEAEWEKAARGTDGRIYPWGNEPDPNRANYADTGIGTTSAVGCFPGGASPYGCEEMIGNVWEWARSLWGMGYPYDPDDGREDLEAEGARVVRGGAFDLDTRFVRCAYRGSSYPGQWNGLRGFRVVVGPGFPL